jgi:hypothetical protein
MAATATRTHGAPTCTVEQSAHEVDAGAELTVTVRLSCPHGCDLKGRRVSVRAQDNTELASAELMERDGEAFVARAVLLRAPLRVGVQVCQAVVAAQEQHGVLHEMTSADFLFVAMAHATSVNVWGLPSAITAGERFRFTVGIKCSAGCKLTGSQLSIVDDEGAHVGTGCLREDLWPGTSALYFAVVEAQAPMAIGDHRWQATIPSSDPGVPHAEGAITFAVKVVSPPDHVVTVEAFDGEEQTPIAGAHVLLHPYRALTDGSGVARLKVAKGRYQLFVSGFNYIAYENVIDVAADVTTRAELMAEPEGHEDYR